MERFLPLTSRWVRRWPNQRPERLTETWAAVAWQRRGAFPIFQAAFRAANYVNGAHRTAVLVLGMSDQRSSGKTDACTITQTQGLETALARIFSNR